MSDIEGAKPRRRCELLGEISLLSQGSFYPLSDGPSIRHRRITNPDFRPCSSCCSHSQARFCICTRRLVSIQPERTFGASVTLWEATAPVKLPPGTLPVLSTRLRAPDAQGWYPTSTPKELASLLLRLPTYPVHVRPAPNASCSKAPWGLSV